MSNNTDPVHLGSFTWNVEELVARYPPKWAHPNKIAVASIATPPGTKHEGSVMASRWQQAGMPHVVKAAQNVQAVAGFFTYDIPQDNDSIHWHLNFADPYLFGYGEGPLLAQDELQITEHPCLASLGKAIEDVESHGVVGLKRLTQEQDGKATPVLVHNAPRRVALDTSGLYGDLFALATQDQVGRATTPLIPPTHTNILALAALSPSYGQYTTTQIQRVLLTAYTGFRAMVLESRRHRVSSAPTINVVLHTGHWGCGAFGGNKGLMCAIQLLAAGMAEVDQVYFYYGFTENDKTAVEHGNQVAQLLSGVPVETAIQKLEHAGYRWGMANENHVPYEPPENCLLKQQQEQPF